MSEDAEWQLARVKARALIEDDEERGSVLSRLRVLTREGVQLDLDGNDDETRAYLRGLARDLAALDSSAVDIDAIAERAAERAAQQTVESAVERAVERAAERAAERAPERVVERLKRQRTEKSLSEFARGDWQRMQICSGFTLHAQDLHLDSAAEPAAAMFQWEDAPENQQLDGAFAHAKELVQLSLSTVAPLQWLEPGSMNPCLLEVRGCERVLYYSSISGNPDIAICTGASIDAGLPHMGLVMLWEVREEGGLGRSTYQAAAELVVANLLSPSLKPVVILTDLRENWRVLWMDDTDVHVGACSNRATAMSVIGGLITQQLKQPSVQLPAALVDRRPLPPLASTFDEEPQRVQELADVLPPEELLQAQALVVLQELARVPALSAMSCR